MEKKRKVKPKKSKAKKVIGHLKGDIKTFRHEMAEDKALIRDLKRKPKSRSGGRYDATPEMLAP